MFVRHLGDLCTEIKPPSSTRVYQRSTFFSQRYALLFSQKRFPKVCIANAQVTLVGCS